MGIIGYGDFGELAHRVIGRQFADVEVRVSSSSNDTDNKTFFEFEAVCQSDVVIVTVPIAVFAEVIEKGAAHFSEDTVMVDVCTVKVHPAEVLQECDEDFSYLCTHPLFGPHSFENNGNSLAGLRIVLSEHNLGDAHYEELKKLLRSLELELIEMSAEEHDRFMARTLFVTHLVGQTLQPLELGRTAVDTPSFEHLMIAAESVADDAKLFADVYQYNPYCKKVLEEYSDALGEVIDQVESNLQEN